MVLTFTALENKTLKNRDTDLNEELMSIQEWKNLNQLTLNIKKNNFIIFRSTKQSLREEVNICLSDHKIK